MSKKAFKRKTISNKRIISLSNLLMPKCRLDCYAVGYSLGIISSLGVLFVGLLGYTNIGADWAILLSSILLMFNLSVSGIFLGMIEAAVYSLTIGVCFSLLYNKLS